jgi:ribosomal protein S24E
MEIEVIQKKDSPLLSRTEISFKIKHPKESTPKRSEVREELALQMSVKKNCVVIDNMQAEFGKPETIGFAKIYLKDKDAREYERKHILKRNRLETGESGKSSEKPKKSEEKPEKPAVDKEVKTEEESQPTSEDAE